MREDQPLSSSERAYTSTVLPFPHCQSSKLDPRQKVKPERTSLELFGGMRSSTPWIALVKSLEPAWADTTICGPREMVVWRRDMGGRAGKAEV